MSTCSPLSAVDAYAVNKVAATLDTGVNQGKIRRRIEEIYAGLDHRDPAKYEPALTQLGNFVGATASKPSGKGRCDSAWCWGNELWLALEAKSDHEPTGVVQHRDIRQANDQLRLLAADRGVDVPPTESATIIISPKPGVHDDGIKGSESHVHLVTPSIMREIAFDIGSAWDDLLARSANRTLPELRQLVADTLNARNGLPSQIHARVTNDPVAWKGA